MSAIRLTIVLPGGSKINIHPTDPCLTLADVVKDNGPFAMLRTDGSMYENMYERLETLNGCTIVFQSWTRELFRAHRDVAAKQFLIMREYLAERANDESQTDAHREWVKKYLGHVNDVCRRLSDATPQEGTFSAEVKKLL